MYYSSFCLQKLSRHCLGSYCCSKWLQRVHHSPCSPLNSYLRRLSGDEPLSICPRVLRAASWPLFQSLVYIRFMLVIQFKDIGIHKRVTVFLSTAYGVEPLGDSLPAGRSVSQGALPAPALAQRARSPPPVSLLPRGPTPAHQPAPTPAQPDFCPGLR